MICNIHIPSRTGKSRTAPRDCELKEERSERKSDGHKIKGLLIQLGRAGSENIWLLVIT